MWFEHPAALALLGLALPWIWFGRRRAPRAWKVGGSEPFRNLEGAATQPRRWPLSLWFGLASLLCATVALAGWRGETTTRRILWDRSLSSRSETQTEEARQALAVRGLEAASAIELGDADRPIAEAEILAALMASFSDGDALVLTDLPRPRGLPESIEWISLSGGSTNAALLNLFFDPESGQWQLHWRNWGCPSPLDLVDSTGTRWAQLEGPGGLLALDALPSGERLRLRTTRGQAPDGRAADDSWVVPRYAKRVRLSSQLDPRWPAALQAVLPEVEIVREAPWDLYLLAEDESETATESETEAAAKVRRVRDFFGELDELDAVASIAAWALPLLVGEAPRPRIECEPPQAPFEWPADASGRIVRSPAEGFDRGLAALGGLLYLGFLFLRMRGR